MQCILVSVRLPQFGCLLHEPDLLIGAESIEQWHVEQLPKHCPYVLQGFRSDLPSGCGESFFSVVRTDIWDHHLPNIPSKYRNQSPQTKLAAGIASWNPRTWTTVPGGRSTSNGIYFRVPDPLVGAASGKMTIRALALFRMSGNLARGPG
jgi:hypothetical protein